MATFFAGMMAFCDVDIIAAEENVVTEATTETAIISTTEEVTTEQNQSELKNNTTKVENKVTISKKHKKDKTSSRRKRPKSKERYYKKKKIAEKNVDSKNEIIKKQKNQKEYIGDYIYFNQTDSIWNNNNLSLRSAGCGPTAVAVCISNLTHKFVSPVTVAGWAKKEGYYSSSGSLHSAIPAMASHWNLQCRGLYKNEKEIERALRSGHMVVGLMGPGYFTKKGHFIVLVAIDDNDQVTVADVGSRQRTQYKYPLKEVIAQTKSASAGGPCWEIYSDQKISAKADKKAKQLKAEKKYRSKEFKAMYNEIKSVLEKNYQLAVPLKKGTLVSEEQFVTITSLGINDKVSVMDASKKLTSDVDLDTVVDEIQTEAVKDSFWNTIMIAPDKTNLIYK